jgi:hypothetical protein
VFEEISDINSLGQNQTRQEHDDPT